MQGRIELVGRDIETLKLKTIYGDLNHHMNQEERISRLPWSKVSFNVGSFEGSYHAEQLIKPVRAVV